MTARTVEITPEALARRIELAIRVLAEERRTIDGRFVRTRVLGFEEPMIALQDEAAAREEHQAIADQWTEFCLRNRRSAGLVGWLVLRPMRYCIVPSSRISKEC